LTLGTAGVPVEAKKRAETDDRKRHDQEGDEGAREARRSEVLY